MKIWIRAVEQDRIGDNFLLAPVVFHFALTGLNAKVEWVVTGAAREFIKLLPLPKNVTLIDKPPHYFGIDLYTASRVWRNRKLAEKLWCPYHPVLDVDWCAGKSYDQKKIIELLYGYDLSSAVPPPTYLVQSPRNHICVAPDAYIGYNRLPMKWLKWLGDNYNVIWLYGSKNSKRYYDLKGNHCVDKSPQDVLRLMETSRLFVSGMSGLLHVASAFGIETLCISFRPDEWNFFKPVYLNNITVLKDEKKNITFEKFKEVLNGTLQR